MQNAARAYLQTQITTTSQADILILLYGGCINFLRQAKEKIEARDVAAKGILLGKAMDVINELQSSLNKDKGGEIAENLNKLYFYCNTRLLMANLKMDTAIIDEIMGIMDMLKCAYEDIKGGTAAESLQRHLAAKNGGKPAAKPAQAAPRADPGVSLAQAAAASPAGPETAPEPAPQAAPKPAPKAVQKPAAEAVQKPAAEAAEGEQPGKKTLAGPTSIAHRRARSAYFNSGA